MSACYKNAVRVLQESSGGAVAREGVAEEPPRLKEPQEEVGRGWLGTEAWNQEVAQGR